MLIPLLLEACPLRDDYAFKLSNVQFYKLYEDAEATMRDVIVRLLGILAMDNRSPAADPQTPPESPAEIMTGEPEEEIPQTPTQIITETPAETITQTQADSLLQMQPETPAQVTVQPQTKHTKRSAPKKKDKGQGKPRSKRVLLILGIVGACVIALCAVGAIIKAANTFEIAGQKFTPSSTRLYFADTELTTQDIRNMQRLKEIDDLTLIRCTFPAKDLGKVLPSVQVSVTLEACGLTDVSASELNLGELQASYLVLDGNPEFFYLPILEPLHDQLREHSCPSGLFGF